MLSVDSVLAIRRSLEVDLKNNGNVTARGCAVHGASLRTQCSALLPKVSFGPIHVSARLKLHVLCSIYLGLQLLFMLNDMAFHHRTVHSKSFPSQIWLAPGPSAIQTIFLKLHGNIRHEPEGLRIPSGVHDICISIGIRQGSEALASHSASAGPASARSDYTTRI
jgi:hypothetical protein